MPATRCRTITTCSTCNKQFSMQTSDYKKKIAMNKGGCVYCKPECFYASRRVKV